MSSQKNKTIVEATSDSQEKTSWDAKTSEQFIMACLDQVRTGERNGTTLTKKGWQNVLTQFNNVSGKNYNKAQLKNKWDNLKKDWQAWYKLFGKETGLGWDHVKNTVDAPDDWWEKKQLENPQYAKFRLKGLANAHELTTLFKDVVATGQYAWAPTSGVLSTAPTDDDVYRPSLDNINIEVNEDSGDSDGDIPLGSGNDIINVNLTPSQEKVGEKRKRVFGKGKRSIAAKIAESVSVMAETCRSRNETVKELITKVPGSTISEVIQELRKIEAIMIDRDFFGRCCTLMMHKDAREMFASLKDVEDDVVAWLRFAAYNPLNPRISD